MQQSSFQSGETDGVSINKLYGDVKNMLQGGGGE